MKNTTHPFPLILGSYGKLDKNGKLHPFIKESLDAICLPANWVYEVHQEESEPDGFLGLTSMFYVLTIRFKYKHHIEVIQEWNEKLSQYRSDLLNPEWR